jgi:uncharacterized delta-60 repeat protein
MYFYHLYNSKARIIMGIGSLDTTFSVDGKLDQNLGGYDIAIGTVIQGDGKIVTVGIMDQQTTIDFYLRRYNRDGSDDNQFNNNAKTTTPSLGSDVRAAATVIQKDGFFYVIGQIGAGASAAANIFIAKYRADGSLETTFGGQSGAPAGFSFVGTAVDDEIPSAAVIQSDGKILIVGSVFNELAQDKDIIIARFNSNGSLDTTFGVAGKVITPIGDEDKALEVKLQQIGTEERIVVTGSTGVAGSEDMILLRYLSTGALDTTFGSGGKVQTSFGSGSDVGRDLVILPGNKIFVVGETTSVSSGKSDIALARYNSDGQLDLSFDQDGKKTINVSASNSGSDGAVKVRLDSKGKIVILGYADSASTGVDSALVRLNSDGNLDASFGTAGVLLTSIGSGASGDNAFAIDINSRDNSIVIAGGIENSTGNLDSFVAKYQGDQNKASLGPDFNSDGKRDFVWRNRISGASSAWFLNGINATSTGDQFFSSTYTDQSWQLVSTGDFDRNGKDDLLWRNATNGETRVWFMDGVNKLSEKVVTRSSTGGNFLVFGNDWQIKATADFDRDGNLDLLWRNKLTGQISAWYLGGADGTVEQSSPLLSQVVGGDWDIRAANDFNLDGYTDIVWRNTVNGSNSIWYLGGTSGIEKQSDQFIDSVGDQSWNIVGSGDFNGDSEADLLWRNSVTSQVSVWSLGGTRVQSFAPPTFAASNDWLLLGGGDFNADGKRDFVWRNRISGDSSAWFLNGINATLTGDQFFNSTYADQSWQLVSTGDFDRNGKDDLLWRNATNGETRVWFMDGVNKLSEKAVTRSSTGGNFLVFGNDWQIKATADFDRDGSLDILWRNKLTGQISAWYLGGADGTVEQSSPLFSQIVGGVWDIRAANDFNLDGYADIVWRNTINGANSIWYLGGASGIEKQSDQFIDSVGDQNWNIVGSGDFNSDSEADLLWRNSITSQVSVWSLGGTRVQAFAPPTFAASNDWLLL